MIRNLIKLGRLKAVSIVTVIASISAIVVTSIAVAILNSNGFDIRFELAIWFAALVPVVVTLPLAWFLVDQIMRILAIEAEMRQLASHDSLTGLLSRRALFEHGANYASLATREKITYSVMAIDLDHFKSINDQHGHAAGDAVLKLFADVLNSVSRRSDIIGRIGGEEFAIVLPSTSTTEALEFSDRLHEAINKAVLSHSSALISYTVSIGISTSEPGTNDGLEQLLVRADSALYQAKHAGRNQTVVYQTEDKSAAVC